MSLEPFNETFKMSSPSDSSSCTSESDLESFTVDEVIGELSELRRTTTVANPLPPRKKPRTTTKEFIAKKKRNNMIACFVFGNFELTNFGSSMDRQDILHLRALLMVSQKGINI